MLRLLFTTRDNDKQLTVITDGIDSQLNIFVTENAVGDVEYFQSLGISVEAGMTYNIGKFKEWCEENALILKGYGEGLGDKEIVYQDVTETISYVFSTETTSYSFSNTGQEQTITITSTKQNYINGDPEGEAEDVDFAIASNTNTAFSVEKTTGGIKVSIAENPTAEQRNTVITLTQNESSKTITINCSQAASVITYDYTLTPSVQSISFVNTGETKTFTVTSTRQKKVNGNDSGEVEQVAYTTVVSGTGFSKGSNDTSVIASSNNTESARSGSVTINQTGGKTAEITLSQAAGTVTYDYVLSVTPESLNFVGGGETKAFTVTSTRQKKINNVISGEPETVAHSNSISGTGFSLNGDSVVAAANQTESQRQGTVTISQTGSSKQETISLTQAAGVVTYDYAMTVQPNSLDFVAEGESKTFTVTSTKQKKINGQNSGSPTSVSYTTSVTGTGFSKGENDTTVVAAANEGADSRSGSVSISASEGGKTATVTLTQAGTPATE